MLGLGYPGGAALERLAAGGDPEAFAFPGSAAERARGGRGARSRAFAEGLNFSFAGVKTALMYTLRELSEESGIADGRLGAKVSVTSVSPPICYEPGMTNSCCAMLEVLVELRVALNDAIAEHYRNGYRAQRQVEIDMEEVSP